MTTIKCKRYIPSQKLIKALSKTGRLTAVVSPTNSGKTEFVLNDLSKHNKVLLLVPSITIGLNKEREGVPFFYHKNPLNNTAQLKQANIATYESLHKLQGDLSDIIVVVDEAHQIARATYRLKSMYNMVNALKRFKKVIFMSATLDRQVFDKVFPRMDWIQIKPEHKRTIIPHILRVNVINKEGHIAKGDSYPLARAKVAMGHILTTRNRPLLVFMQNKGALHNLKQYFAEYAPMIISSVEAKRTVANTPEESAFLKSGVLPKGCRVILATSSLYEGVDIHHDKPIDTMIVTTSLCEDGKLWDINLQASARSRNQQRTDLYIVSNTFMVRGDNSTGTEWDTKSHNKQMYAQIINGYHNKAFSPEIYEALATSEGEPTPTFKLQTLQRSKDKWATENSRNEVIEYYKRIDEGHSINFPEEITLEQAVEETALNQKVDYHLAELLFKTDVYSTHSQGATDSYAKQVLEGAVIVEDEILDTAVKIAAEGRRELLPTMTAREQLQDELSMPTAKEIEKAHKNMQYLYSNMNLVLLREHIWKHWRGKTFTHKEFINWLNSYNFNKWFRSHKELKKYEENIHSTKAFTTGIFSKLFAVNITKSKYGKNKKDATYNIEDPTLVGVLGSATMVHWHLKYHYAHREEELKECMFDPQGRRDIKKNFKKEYVNVINLTGWFDNVA